MPSNLLNADVGFPRLNENQSADEKIQKITDYLYMLLEQLRYSFGNVDKDNFSESGLSELEHLFTDPVYARIANDEGKITELFLKAEGLGVRVSDAEGNINTLTVTAQVLNSRITDAEGNLSTLTQTVNSIQLGVSNGEESSTITLYRNGIAVSSQLIQFSGMVTFTDLSTPGATIIHGGNLMTGTVTADHVKANISISSPTITGGNINGAAFHNARGNASLELGADSGGYGDLTLYGYNSGTGNKWEVFRVVDNVGGAKLSIYGHDFLTGSSATDKVTPQGEWDFRYAEPRVPYGYSLPRSGKDGQVFFLLE